MYRIKPTKEVDNILYSRYVNIVYNLLQFNYSLLHISFAIVLILYFAFTFYITKFSRYSHHFEGNIVSNWNIASITCLVQLMNMFPNHLRRQLEYCIARMLYLTCLRKFHPHFLFQNPTCIFANSEISTVTSTVSSPFKIRSSAPLDHV